MTKARLLIESENEISLSKNDMIIAVEAERGRREAQGFHFNCIVVNSYDKYKKTKHTELVVLLTNLRRHFEKGLMRDNTRIQLLIQFEKHWSAADIQFSKENGISVFMIDAAGDPRWTNVLTNISKALCKSHQPAPSIFISEGGIQWDSVHCAVFSLHHAYRTAKIGDLHQDLSQRKATFAPGVQGEITYYKVHKDQLPPLLIKTMQRSHSIDGYLEKNPHLISHPVSKSGSNVSAFIWEHTAHDGKYISNKYIYRIKNKAKKIVIHFINETDENVVHTLLHKHQEMALYRVRNINDMPAYQPYSTSGLFSPPTNNETVTVKPNHSVNITEPETTTLLSNTIDDDKPFTATFAQHTKK